MKKVSRWYCAVSFAVAMVIVCLSLLVFIRYPEVIYAKEITTDEITDELEDVSSFDEKKSNINYTNSNVINVLSIIYNNEEGSLSTSVRVFLVLTILSLAPSILVMLTSYTRIIIVLHFVRTAIGTQTAPPNQVLIGLALFLTFFIMWPTFQTVNENALKPLDAGTITIEEALKEAEEPFREFMYGQTQRKDLELFVDMSGKTYESYEEIPFTTLVPSFILSELRTAFIIGFLIYIPFIVIDMVVSSVLMSM